MFSMLSDIKAIRHKCGPPQPARRSPAEPQPRWLTYQCADQSAFVIGRATHVGLRISNGLSRFSRTLDCLFCERPPAQSTFSICCSYRNQADTTQRDRRIFTNIVVHRELHGGTRRRINRGRAFERQGGPATSLSWHFHRYFTD